MQTGEIRYRVYVTRRFLLSLVKFQRFKSNYWRCGIQRIFVWGSERKSVCFFLRFQNADICRTEHKSSL